MIIRNCDFIFPEGIPYEIIKAHGAKSGTPIVELYEGEAEYRDGLEMKIRIYINTDDEFTFE